MLESLNFAVNEKIFSLSLSLSYTNTRHTHADNHEDRCLLRLKCFPTSCSKNTAISHSCLPKCQSPWGNKVKFFVEDEVVTSTMRRRRLPCKNVLGHLCTSTSPPYFAELRSTEALSSSSISQISLFNLHSFRNCKNYQGQSALGNSPK